MPPTTSRFQTTRNGTGVPAFKPEAASVEAASFKAIEAVSFTGVTFSPSQPIPDELVKKLALGF